MPKNTIWWFLLVQARAFQVACPIMNRPGLPGHGENWVDEIFGQYRKTKAIKD